MMKTNIVIVTCPKCKSDEIKKRILINSKIKILLGFECLDCNYKFDKKEAKFEDISAEMNYNAQ